MTGFAALRTRRAALLLLAGGAVAAAGPMARAAAQADNFDFSRSSSEPIRIDATEGIEWRREQRVYIARGNARVARGDLAIYADKLSAFYREGAGGKTDITRVIAEGNVRLTSPDQTVTGDVATYDIAQGVLVVTGEELRAETRDEVLTARDRFEYWEKQLVLVARGDAEVIEADRRVKADVLTGYLKKQPDGSTKLYQVEAEGNVQIWRDGTYATASKAVYSLENEVAKLIGSVKITRGENQLNGETAEFDLRSGVSRILGGGGKPVQSLIIPSEAPTQPPP